MNVKLQTTNERQKMKTYIGLRSDGDTGVYVEEDGQRYPLNPRLDIRNHSPSGFEWGYSGSGPAQLALAILADHYGPGVEKEINYQQFKDDVIALLPRDGNFILTTWDIERWAESRAVYSLAKGGKDGA